MVLMNHVLTFILRLRRQPQHHNFPSIWYADLPESPVSPNFIIDIAIDLSHNDVKCVLEMLHEI